MSSIYTHEVIPGVLEKNWEEIEEKIEKIRNFSNKIHIDIIDGKFADNLTFLDPAPFLKYSKEIFFEAHLMVEEPINYLDSFAKAGFKRFLGHVEKMSNQAEFIAKGELLGEVGLCLDLGTSEDAIKVSFEDLDLVLVMSVKAGFSKQEFNESSLGKIRALREKSPIAIEVDGGINDQATGRTKEAGANVFVATSFISDSQNPQEQYEKLKSSLV